MKICFFKFFLYAKATTNAHYVKEEQHFPRNLQD